MIITYILACSMGVITFGCSTVGLGKKADSAKEEIDEFCSANKMFKVNKRVYDFDACSLYPSSMYFLALIEGGFLRGIPKIIKNENLDYDYLIKNTDGFFIEIKINNLRMK